MSKFTGVWIILEKLCFARLIREVITGEAYTYYISRHTGQVWGRSKMTKGLSHWWWGVSSDYRQRTNSSKPENYGGSILFLFHSMPPAHLLCINKKKMVKFKNREAAVTSTPTKLTSFQCLWMSLPSQNEGIIMHCYFTFSSTLHIQVSITLLST